MKEEAFRINERKAKTNQSAAAAGLNSANPLQLQVFFWHFTAFSHEVQVPDLGLFALEHNEMCTVAKG